MSLTLVQPSLPRAIPADEMRRRFPGYPHHPPPAGALERLAWVEHDGLPLIDRIAWIDTTRIARDGRGRLWAPYAQLWTRGVGYWRMSQSAVECDHAWGSVARNDVPGALWCHSNHLPSGKASIIAGIYSSDFDAELYGVHVDDAESYLHAPPLQDIFTRMHSIYRSCERRSISWDTCCDDTEWERGEDYELTDHAIGLIGG